MKGNASQLLQTASELQKALVAEETKLLSDIHTKDILGEVIIGIKGYEQQLPISSDDEDDISDSFPYFIVRVADGKTEDDDSPWLVSVDILFGIHDADKQADGHRHIMNMIQRTIDRFAAEPLLANAFRAQPEMEWALQDEDTYPYYFGGVRMKFNVPKVGRSVPSYGKGEEYC